MGPNVKITLISKDQHCLSCTMSDQIVREVLQQIKTKNPEYQITYISLDADQECTIPAVKIHQFPSILLNNKQITAGSIITEERLEELINEI